MQIGPIEKRTHTKERTMLLIFIFGSCYCIIMMHCLQKSICDSHLSEDDLIFIVWKWSPRKTDLLFVQKNQLSKGFYWSVDLKFHLLSSGFTKDYLPGCYTVCHFDVYLFPWFSTRILITKFSNGEKGREKSFSEYDPSFRKQNSTRAVDLTFRG